MRNVRTYVVYIMSNVRHTVLYTGVTSNLPRRVSEHRTASERSFTCRYHVTCLVYWEQHSSVADAIAREKQIKSWSRRRKVDLINSINPTWSDLADEL